MEAAEAPVVHNPAKLWDDEIARKRLEVQAVPTNNAPRDIVQDIRKEPEWLIPEIRQWGSLKYSVRASKINWLMALPEPEEGKVGVTASSDFKARCFRWLLTVEPDRRLAKAMFDAIWPDEEWKAVGEQAAKRIGNSYEQETRETEEMPIETPKRRGRPKKAQ